MPIGGEKSYLGSPTEIVTRGRSPSHCSRALKGLEAALIAKLITIKSTPSPIMYDPPPGIDASKMLGMAEGVLVPADPCWAGP
jgi:hypothetical protein